MDYTAKEIAEYVIRACTRLKRPISNLQLQKILYYLQGYFLAIYNTPLFSGEIEAWRLGPVVPSVYHKYSFYGSAPIVDNSNQQSLDELTPQQQKLLDSIVANKSLKTAWQLVEDTHSERPWKSTRQSEVIDNQLIASSFDDIIVKQLQEGI